MLVLCRALRRFYSKNGVGAARINTAPFQKTNNLKMRHLIPLPVFLFFTQFLLAQNGIIHLENPSFEGIPCESGKDNVFPKGWQDCGFKGETPFDVFSIEGGGTFQVTQEPLDGDTYIGMVVRENEVVKFFN